MKPRGKRGPRRGKAPRRATMLGNLFHGFFLRPGLLPGPFYAKGAGMGCIPAYRDAREFFEAARCAAQDMESASRQLERLRASEGLRAQGYGQGFGRRADADGMGATVARIDWEGRMRERLREDSALVESALGVAYGSDGRGGIRAVLGGGPADVVAYRYCRAMDWQGVAMLVGRSVSWCRKSADAAMDVCDAYGMLGMLAGEGIACE